MRNLLTAPSTIIALVLFIISFTASVYAPEFRRVLAMPPNKALSLWKSVRLRQHRVRLGQLELLHNNVYQLLLSLMFLGGLAGIGTATALAFIGIISSLPTSVL
jgi:hypothetical protein